jgi:anti-sigma factor RsiW
MHRLVEQNLEEILNNRNITQSAAAHMSECAECRQEVAAMREHVALLRTWRAPAQDLEPRPGFYARVRERIEAQTPVSIWNLFFDSIFGRRLAVASLSLAMLLGVYLISTDQVAEEVAVQNTPEAAMEVLPVPVISGQFVAIHDNAGVMSLGEPSQDSVLVNLVTYREQ